MGRIFLSLLILIACTINTHAFSKAFQAFSQAPVAASGAAPTCTIGSGAGWVNVADNDYVFGDATYANNWQWVANASSKDICRIDVNAHRAGGGTLDVKICDTDCATNCVQSDDVSVAVETLGFYQFDFAAGVTKTGNFKVCFSGGVYIHYATVNTYFGSTADGENMAYQGTVYNGGDLNVKVYYKQ